MATKTKEPTHVLIQVYSDEDLITIIPFNKNDIKSMMKLSEYIHIGSEEINKYGLTASIAMGPKEMFAEIQESARLDDEHSNLILTISEFLKTLKTGRSFLFDSAAKFRT